MIYYVLVGGNCYVYTYWNVGIPSMVSLLFTLKTNIINSINIIL